ncbi:hypothetical protein HDU97_005644 [Phlyctochytrium planicorne]|nr:hypothetical protein HDU97_005644 [Phlyctochytrium planicorne]
MGPNIQTFDRAIACIDSLRVRAARMTGGEGFEDDDDALTILADIVAGIRSCAPYVMIRDLDSFRKAGANLLNPIYAEKISQKASLEELTWSSAVPPHRDSLLALLDQTISYFDIKEESGSPSRSAVSRRDSSPRSSHDSNRVSPNQLKALLKALRASVRTNGFVDVDQLIQMRTYSDVAELRRRFWGLEQVLESVELCLGKVFERFLLSLIEILDEIHLQESPDARTTSSVANLATRKSCKSSSKMKILLATCLVVLSFALMALAWEQEDFQIFDLHDSLAKIKGEKDENGNKIDFYSVLEIAPTASASELTKAYRKASLTLHPDKNPSPEAAALYALLTSINKILKDEGMRERYDRHRARGIPRWRGTGYFLARYKPGVVFIVTFIIGMISFAQYLTAWIMFYQSRQTPTEDGDEGSDAQITYSQIRKKLKRAGIAETPEIKKAIKNNVPPAEILKMISEAPKTSENGSDDLPAPKSKGPAITDTLIFQLPVYLAKFAYNVVTGKAFAKKPKPEGDEFVADEEYEEEDYEENEDVVLNKPTSSPGKKSNASAASTTKPSEKLRQRRLKKGKKDDDEEEEEEEKVQRPKKKTLGPGMIRSASGVVMSKQDFIKQKQKELAAGKQ